MARVVEEPLCRGARRPRTLDRLVDAAARDVAGPGDDHRPRRPRPGRLRALRRGPRSKPRITASRPGGEGGASRRASGARPAAAPPSTKSLLYVAVPVRQGGRRPGRRAGGRGRFPASRNGWATPPRGRPRPAPGLPVTAALSALLARPLAGPLEEIMTAAREFARRQPGHAHPGAPERRARGAGAHPEPVRGPAPGAAHRERPRPRAQRGHPLRHGGRGARGGPQGDRPAREQRAAKEPRARGPGGPALPRGDPPEGGGRGRGAGAGVGRAPGARGRAAPRAGRLPDHRRALSRATRACPRARS